MAEIEIYTSPFCGFCNAAKKLLEKKGVAYTEFDVMMNGAKRQEMIERAGGLTSVPQIFVDGEHLGDCMDMMEMDADGELDARLKLPGDEDGDGDEDEDGDGDEDGDEDA